MSVYERELAGGLVDKYAAVVRELPEKCTILELGCATGYFASELVKRGFDVTGIERDPDAVLVARSRGVKVIHADIDVPDAFCGFEDKFDVILAMDVLEHLATPDRLLRQLRRILRPGGKLIITGPNVAFWSVRISLLRGHWIYRDSGVMDATHLRWYTLASWTELIESNGFTVMNSGPAERGTLPAESYIRKLMGADVARGLANFATKRLPRLFAIVFLFVARES
jgi:methionine biosynthesis protein MetW